MKRELQLALAKIEIEEVRHGFWRVEVEAGRPIRRKMLHTTNFDDAIQLVIDAYAEAVPEPAPASAGPVLPAVRHHEAPAVPIGKRTAAHMRAAADDAAASHERQGAIRTRKL